MFSFLCEEGEDEFQYPSCASELLKKFSFDFLQGLLTDKPVSITSHEREEFLKLEREILTRTLLVFPSRSITEIFSRTTYHSTCQQYIELDGRLFHKHQLLSQLTSVDKTSLDRSRTRRFDKQPKRRVSKEALQFSQHLSSPVTTLQPSLIIN